MLRAMLTALLVVIFIGPTHSQGVPGAGVSGALKNNQPRFNQARPGAMRQTTKPGGPAMEANAKKKAKKDKCAKLPQPATSQDTPNQKTPSPRRPSQVEQAAVGACNGGHPVVARAGRYPEALSCRQESGACQRDALRRRRRTRQPAGRQPPIGANESAGRRTRKIEAGEEQIQEGQKAQG